MPSNNLALGDRIILKSNGPVKDDNHAFERVRKNTRITVIFADGTSGSFYASPLTGTLLVLHAKEDKSDSTFLERLILAGAVLIKRQTPAND